MHAMVLAGGLSYERDVSLRSGRRVADALRRAGVETTIADADANLLAALHDTQPDAVYIALHGAPGEDGALRAVLDAADVPYVGAGAAESRLAWDKPVAKTLLRRAGIDTPDWMALPHETFRELGAAAVLERVVKSVGMPLMVKPVNGGSGLGATPVFDAADLPSAMMSCFAYGGTALLERFVAGIDVAVTVIDLGDGPRALPAVEIEPADGVYDYVARYTAGVTRWHTPPRLAPEVAQQVAEVALQAHTALGIRDLSRVDTLVDPDGRAHVLEVSVSPGMTETSLTPMAIAAADLDLGEVCRTLIERAATR
ncbi:D-alanine--D-alanine ligase family protein [Fodinicola acaciae]|uniref:D-alanine--D-alanine ligase family protein n=1 Tax=Fodinicola acaciae TaxID=2681555 RepID=UPI0013D14977|nr:D-alanine--D-alanine ligase [Fodinicola acaciae]